MTAIAFWTAALLPFGYLPVLAAGIDSPTRLAVLLAFLGLNVVAFVVGHDYAGRHAGGAPGR